jgi:hypothetical protein
MSAVSAFPDLPGSLELVGGKVGKVQKVLSLSLDKPSLTEVLEAATCCTSRALR